MTTAETAPGLGEYARYAMPFPGSSSGLSRDHPDFPEPGQLAKGIEKLFAQQLATDVFPELYRNVQALGQTKLRTGSVGTSPYNVLYNPARERRSSSPWEVRTTSPCCYLDPNVLFEGQRGIEFEGLLVATNPFPALNSHVTGIYPSHARQSLGLMLTPAILLAKAMGSDYFTFYNAEGAGASAPGHSHIQAARQEQLPIESSLNASGLDGLRHSERDGTIYVPRHLGRTVVLIESDHTESAIELTRRVVGGLAMAGVHVADRPDEPRVNIVARHTDKTRVMVFPRSTQEAVGFAPAYKPATLEMAGIFIAPTRKVFNEMDHKQVEQTLAAMSVPHELVAHAVCDLGKVA